MDVILALLAWKIFPGWLPWVGVHFQSLVWLLAPGQVLAIFCMALAFELPKIPKWASRRWRPLYAAGEAVYGLGFVLSVGSLLWHYLFVPKHAFGAAWALGLTLFGSLFAFGYASEARFGDTVWWRKLPIWAFLYFAVLMLQARSLSPLLLLGALTLSYLPLRLSLSWGKEISLPDFVSALLTWALLTVICD
jgi:hypothetical protein